MSFIFKGFALDFSEFGLLQENFEKLFRALSQPLASADYTCLDFDYSG